MQLPSHIPRTAKPEKTKDQCKHCLILAFGVLDERSNLLLHKIQEQPVRDGKNERVHTVDLVINAELVLPWPRPGSFLQRSLH